jgi:hypothetical protein
MNTKQIEPQEMAEKLLREIGGWFITNETQQEAFEYCVQRMRESESEDEKDYWDEVSSCIYAYGMNFN